MKPTKPLRRREFLSLSTLLLAGCGGGGGSGSNSNPDAAISAPASAPPAPADASMAGIIKDPTPLVVNGSETAMVVFNGEALAITFVRPFTASAASAIRVRRWSTGEVLAEHPWTGGMGCAIVKDGAIHIFGNTNWQSPGNNIIHSVLAPDFTPSAPVDALLNDPAKPFKFYNTDVTADATGFRMVVETTAGIFFATSTDLATWTWASGQLKPGEYCGCPSIDYIGGAHYLTFLEQGPSGTYQTAAAKSSDNCLTFSYGRVLLAPEASDGINCSDVDMVEVGGKVCGVYLDGDQSTHGDLCRWTYGGTLEQLFSEVEG